MKRGYPTYLDPQAKGYACLGQPRELKPVVTTKCEAQPSGLRSTFDDGSDSGGGSTGGGGGANDAGRGDVESSKLPLPAPTRLVGR